MRSEEEIRDKIRELTLEKISMLKHFLMSDSLRKDIESKYNHEMELLEWVLGE